MILIRKDLGIIFYSMYIKCQKQFQTRLNVFLANLHARLNQIIILIYPHVNILLEQR